MKTKYGTMTKHGITIRHNKNGTWRVSGKDGDEKWSLVALSFNEAGQLAFEMADNNDIGRDVNHSMCAFFGRSFF